jgi:hypothetical protein
VGGVSAAVSKTAAAPIERVKLLIQNQVCAITQNPSIVNFSWIFRFGHAWVSSGSSYFPFLSIVDFGSDSITSAVTFTITTANSMAL